MTGAQIQAIRALRRCAADPHEGYMWIGTRSVKSAWVTGLLLRHAKQILKLLEEIPGCPSPPTSRP